MKRKKAVAIARKGRRLRQVGALPFQRDAEGNLMFLLVTSRGTKRFVIPKGWRLKMRSDAESAAAEAEQEAGVTGKPTESPIGSYFYWKRLKKVFVPITVDVYALHVEEALTDWREGSQRSRKWVSAEQAMALVDEPQLVQLLREARATL
jgi:8-oxo-dGTP pyrophosphatase MutT (NUDIX family)